MTERVKLSECRKGDVIQAHGGRWELAELYSADDRPMSREMCAQGGRGNGFRAWRSVFLGNSRDGVECSVPRSWRNDYTIQSNDFAVWEREVRQMYGD